MKPSRITLNGLLIAAAKEGPRRAAMVFADNTLSYYTLLEQVERTAAGLQALGLKRGDRVALLMQNCPQFIIAFFGILRAGGIVTSTSPIYTAREASHQWQDSGARFLFADRSLAGVAEAARALCPELKTIIWTEAATYAKAGALQQKRSLAHPFYPPQKTPDSLNWVDFLRIRRSPAPNRSQPSDVACLQYTGGTTGVSKGAMLTHHNLALNAYQTCNWLLRTKTDHERFVAALPLFHIYATTCVMISAIQCRGSVVILPRFELEPVLQAVKKHRPTIFHGVPTMYVAFNHVPNIADWGFGSLRVCMSGGAPLPISVQQQFESLTGAKLVEGYGLTECSPVTHVNPPGAARAGSVGMPIPGTQARIVDIETGERDLPLGEAGELIIRGPQVMKGYWNKPEETARVLRKGWLHTGDIATCDKDGYYCIVDRTKDLILVGGFNVYPREVEEVLFLHPGILEAGVIGVTDEYRGESVKAFVVCRPGISLTEEEIIAHCRKSLAAYKVPRQVEFRDSLPKSGVGKYLRRELRKSGT